MSEQFSSSSPRHESLITDRSSVAPVAPVEITQIPPPRTEESTPPLAHLPATETPATLQSTSTEGPLVRSESAPHTAQGSRLAAGASDAAPTSAPMPTATSTEAVQERQALQAQEKRGARAFLSGLATAVGLPNVGILLVTLGVINLPVLAWTLLAGAAIGVGVAIKGHIDRTRATTQLQALSSGSSDAAGGAGSAPRA